MPAPYTLMGILNVTPESSDEFGGSFDPDSAIRHGIEMAGEGASILDVGGESTTPLSHEVPADEELRRVIPVIEGLVAELPGTTISIDTTKAVVAQAALGAGATYVNDISAMRQDPDMLRAVVEHGASCCMMHMRGNPRTMQGHTRYEDVVQDVRWFLERRVDLAVAAGVPIENIDVDPGIGFAKTEHHDLEILRRLQEIATLGPRVVVGTSRKTFVPELTGVDDSRSRIAASVATNVLALHAGAQVFRVHDVGMVHDALAIAAFVGAPDVLATAAVGGRAG